MKVYELNGKLYRFADNRVPSGAVLHSKAKTEAPKNETVEVEEKPKAKKPTKNKAKKVEANK